MLPEKISIVGTGRLAAAIVLLLAFAPMFHHEIFAAPKLQQPAKCEIVDYVSNLGGFREQIRYQLAKLLISQETYDKYYG
jgi:hypothetical protein